MSGPGLPAVLGGESYSCHFEDSLERFNITVPSVEVGSDRTQYTCDITNEVQLFGGVQAGRFFLKPTNGSDRSSPTFFLVCSDAFQFC